MRECSYEELIKLNNIVKHCSIINNDTLLNAMCANYIYQFIDNANITYELKCKLQGVLRKVKHFDYGK